MDRLEKDIVNAADTDLVVYRAAQILVAAGLELARFQLIKMMRVQPNLISECKNQMTNKFFSEISTVIDKISDAYKVIESEMSSINCYPKVWDTGLHTCKMEAVCIDETPSQYYTNLGINMIGPYRERWCVFCVPACKKDFPNDVKNLEKRVKEDFRKSKLLEWYREIEDDFEALKKIHAQQRSKVQNLCGKCPDGNCKYEFPDRSKCGVAPFQLGYRGNIAITKSGRTCQRWDKQSPHRHDRTPQRYPYSGLVQNFCRNPDFHPGLAWCYTTDPNKRWEECAVPDCNSKCGTAPKQQDYRGDIAVTKSGKTCQRWNQQSPHIHVYAPPLYPDEGLGENFCRNPIGVHPGGAWCFTTDPGTRWEECAVPDC